MKRVAFKMKLNRGCKEEYALRHNNISSELAQTIRESGVSDYSIFFDEETDTLFAVQNTISDTGSQDIGDKEIVQKWWEYMSDIMEVNPDCSPVSTPLEEVFYLK